MTHIVGLRLHNWTRFRGTFELPLDRGTYAIVAAAADEPGRSNWLGKSALLGAIRYALEGHKPKVYASLDALIAKGETDMSVDVELSDGTFISRAKKRGKATDLEVNLPTVDDRPLVLFKDQAEQAIWKTLGLIAADLESTAYAEQRKLGALVAADSSVNLTDLVNGWLQLDRLEAAADAAGSCLRAKAKELREVEARHRTLTEQLVPIDQAALERRVQELKLEVTNLQLRRQHRAQLLAQHQAWSHLRDRRTQAVIAVVEALALWAGYLTVPPVKGHATKLEQRVLDARSAAEFAVADYRQKRKLASGKFDGCCPVNGDTCPITAQLNSQRIKNAELVAAAERAHTAAEADVLNATAPLNLFRRANQVLQAARNRFDSAVRNLPTWADDLAAPLPLEPQVQALTDDASPQVELDRLADQYARFQQVTTELNQAARRLKELTREVAVARAAFAVLGPEGAQRRIAQRAVEAIDSAANRELRAAGIDLRVSAQWGRETQKPAEQCPQCGAAFPRSTTVKTCEQCLAPRGLKVTPDLHFRLSHVSGAAEDLAGLAVRCAAFKWLRAKRHASWSVAVLDEPFSQVDAFHRRALSAHIQRLLDGTFDQAFVVAHDAHVLDSFPHRILITGRGDWSDAKVVA